MAVRREEEAPVLDLRGPVHRPRTRRQSLRRLGDGQPHSLHPFERPHPLAGGPFLVSRRALRGGGEVRLANPRGDYDDAHRATVLYGGCPLSCGLRLAVSLVGCCLTLASPFSLRPASLRPWRCPARLLCTSLPARNRHRRVAASRAGASSGCVSPRPPKGVQELSPRRWG